MVGTVQNIFTKRYRRFWVTVGAWALVVIYLTLTPYAAQKGGDFVHLWVGGRLVAQGAFAHLYDPSYHHAILESNRLPLQIYWGPRYDILGVFFYPPITGLLYAPFGALPLYWGQALQALVNVGLGIGAAWLLTQLLNQRLRFPVVLLLLFTFPSFFFAYVLGQNGILTITLVLASWYWLTVERAWGAGVFLSMLVYKPNWLFAFGWIPLVQRQWRLLLGLASGLFILLLLMVSLMGIAPLQAYLANLTNLLGLHDLPNYPLETQFSMLSLFRRYLGMSTLATILGWGAALSLMVATVAATRFSSSRQTTPQPVHLVAVALSWLTAVCINPHLHHYDLPLVGVVLIIALSEWQTLYRWQRITLTGIVLFNYLAFPISAFFALNTLVPLPLFAMLSAWLWLWGRTQAKNAEVATVTAGKHWSTPSYAMPEA